MLKKLYSFLTLLTAFLWLGSGTMWGDEPLTITVGDETSTNYSVPICAYYFDMGFHTQIIYLKDDLSTISGGTISGLTFYSSTTSQTWTSGATVNVKLMETDAENFTSTTFTDVSSATINYAGQFNISENKVTITLSSEFEYSGDGNLLVDINMASSSSSTPSIAFYGTTSSGASLSTRKKSGTYTYGLGIVDFYPKTTFEYTAAAPETCAKPTTVEVAEENIGSNSATITLDGLNNATIEYKKKSAADYSVAKEGVTGTSYELTGLDSYTEYDVQVKNVCSGTDGESKYVKASFQTKCGANPLPFSEDFSAELTSCWTLRNTVSGTGVTSGYFTFKYTKSPSEYLITPEIAVTGNPVKVEFEYWKYTYGTETFSVGYSTTTNETSEFTWGSEVTATNTSTNKLTYSETLPANVKYVAIQYSSDDQYYLYIDNFSLVEDVLPACPKPTALAKSAQTNNSATLSWTKNGSETSWNVQYSTTSDFSSDNHIAVANTNNSYVLSGLSANTHYYVHVQAACEGDYSDAIDFTTDCDPISSVSTWTDGGFEDETENAVPSCWIAKTTDESNQYKPAMYVNTSASYVRTGSKSLLMKAYNDSGEGYAIFPVISDASLSSLQLKFWHKKEVAAFILKVGYLTDINDLSSFTELHTCTNATAWTEEDVDLSTLPSGARLAFYYFGTSYTSKYAVAVDDISFATPPTCFKPLNLSAAANITPDGATFSWEASGHGETTYQWAVAAGSDAPAWVDDAAHKTSELTKTVTGLATGSYKFYVRSYCSELEQSDAAVSAAFTTATVPAPTIGTITATNNSANASWTAPTGVSYSVQYQWSIDGSSWSEPTSALSAAITSLEQNTSYTFYVRSYYDASHQSANATKAFKTACDPISVTSEFTENFDGITSGIPDCWNNDEGTTTNESYKWNSATGGQSGRCVRFESRNNGSGKTNILASPLYTITSDADLTFYVKNYKGGAYDVKISVNGGERQTLFTGLTNIQNWTKKEVALSDHIGKTVQFFFCGTSNWSENSNGYLYLDEFKITPISCRKPASDPVVTSKDDTHATITWTAGGANTDYQFALALKDEAPVWDAANVVTAFTKSFDDLRQLTWYDFYVRTYCDELNQSEARKVTFQTECASFVTLPFEQNFNSVAADAIPECWDNSEGTSTDYYKWKGYTYGGTHGTNCVRFNSSTNDADATNVLATPTVQLGEGNLLTFWAKNPTGGDFKVQIKEEGAEAADLLTTGLTGLADWTLKYVAIPDAYNNKKVQILFHATSNEGDANAYIYLDDVRVARGEFFADGVSDQVEPRLSGLSGQTIDFVMTRPMQYNGYYNTLCLPFNISAADMTDNEHPFYNCTVKAFDYAVVTDELQLAIVGVSSIEAGVPYFVRYDGTAIADKTALLFKEVTISAAAPSAKEDNNVTYSGIFNTIEATPEATTDHAPSCLFVGGENQLYWPTTARKMNAFRAYFTISYGAGSPIRRGMPARLVDPNRVPTDIENTNAFDAQTIKFIENNQVVIIRNGVKYNIQGQVISK